MAVFIVPPISKENCETIQHFSNLLQLFHHRNKNQHRRSVWWRQFSIFRTQLRRLNVTVQKLQEIPASHLAKAKKKSEDKQTLGRIEQQLAFWENVMVPKWHHAFSQLTADGRFATLGLVLLSLLAETCQITGITKCFESLGQAEVETILERFARSSSDIHTETTAEAPTASEDIGEAINRESANHDLDTPENDTAPAAHEASGHNHRLADSCGASDTGKPSKQECVKSNRTKKKTRKGNVIDDLFSGLG